MVSLLAAGCRRAAPAPQARVAAAAAPVLDSVTPAEGAADPGVPVEVTLHGAGFTATDNTVVFGPATVAGVASANDGRRIRVVLPKELPATGEAPPMRLDAGTYDIMVRNRNGASNIVRFTLR